MMEDVWGNLQLNENKCNVFKCVIKILHWIYSVTELIFFYVPLNPIYIDSNGRK